MYFDITGQQASSFLSVYRSYWTYADEVAEVLDQVSGAGPYGMKTIKEIRKR